jgi:hypothetical protein
VVVGKKSQSGTGGSARPASDANRRLIELGAVTEPNMIGIGKDIFQKAAGYFFLLGFPILSFKQL